MKKILFSSAALALLIGCGSGGGSNDSSNTQTKTGTFEDSPVSGLYYETSSGLTGFTDENGSFKYKEGDSVTFKIGNVLIGKVNSGSLVTPYTFGAKAKDIAYVLQNLDTDGNVSNSIQLPTAKVLKDTFSGSDLTTMKSKLSDIKTEIKNSNSNSNSNVHFPDIDENKALSNMNNYLASKDSNDTFIKDVLKNGLLALKGRKLYGLEADSLSDIYTVESNFSKDGTSLTGKVYESGEEFHTTTELTKDSWTDGDGNTYKLLKIDIQKHLVFSYYKKGVIVLSSSKEAIENYKKELEKKYPKTAIDPKTLKGKYLYEIPNDKYSWHGIILGDDNVTVCDDIDDIFDNPTKCSSTYTNTKDFEYLDGNKFKYLDEGNWKQDEVYKIPLANKDVNVYMLGAAFNANKVFPQQFTRFGIDTIHFTKGNAYCNLIENKCWIDGDALKELGAAWNNVNYSYANMKGEAKTPKYSKISDYLKDKNQNYYLVYTKDGYIDYEHDWLDSKKEFCYQELERNQENLDNGCYKDSGNVEIKILKEYDNGILVEMNDQGKPYKTFFYNNEEDAKKVYQTLLPKYSN